MPRPRKFFLSSDIPSSMARPQPRSKDSEIQHEKTRNRSPTPSTSSRTGNTWKSNSTLGILRDKETDSVPGTLHSTCGALLSQTDHLQAPFSCFRELPNEMRLLVCAILRIEYRHRLYHHNIHRRTAVAAHFGLRSLKVLRRSEQQMARSSSILNLMTLSMTH